MRTLWRGLVRIVLWSFDRGTWPYDVAVAVIVLFVMFSPRSWFNDGPQVNTLVATAPVPATVELRGIDPVDGATIYRVDARLISQNGSDLQQRLHEALSKHDPRLAAGTDFEILRVASVRGRNGSITHYDVCVKP